MELAELVPNTFTNKNIPSTAMKIIKNYWDLRTDEILYVLNKGATSKYGTIYGNVHYSTIADWLNKYIIEERDYYMEEERIRKHSAATDIRSVTATPEEMYLNAKYTEPTKDVKKQATLDEQQADLFLVFKEDCTGERLLEMLEHHRRHGHTKTATVIEQEIERRKNIQNQA